MAVGIVVGGTWMLQDRLIYFPGTDPGPPPADWEPIGTVTRDGLSLMGWLSRPDPGETAPVIVVFSGNAGNRAGRVPLGRRLINAGFVVVLCEYRGYGGNPGTPGEKGLLEDAHAFISSARDRFGPTRTLVYYGESLGAAVAIGVTEDDPPDALVLGSPFTSLREVGKVHYPWLPVDRLLRDSYASLSRIERGVLEGVPTLVIAGTADQVVPFGQSLKVAEAAGAELYEVVGADHNDVELRSSAGMVGAIAEFIETATGS